MSTVAFIYTAMTQGRKCEVLGRGAREGPRARTTHLHLPLRLRLRRCCQRGAVSGHEAALLQRPPRGIQLAAQDG